MTTMKIRMVVTMLMMMMTTTAVWSLKCEKTGLCTCNVDGVGTIDLSPLASNSTEARFKDIPGPQAPYVYSWNPCNPFTEGRYCDQVAVCTKNTKTNECYNLGFPTSADFFTWPDGRLSLQYMVGGGDGIITVSSIDLICNHTEEAHLQALGKVSLGLFVSTLLHIVHLYDNF